MHHFTIKTRFRTIATHMINIQTQKRPLSFSQKFFPSFRIRNHLTFILPMETFRKNTFGCIDPRQDLEFPATCNDEPVNKSSTISFLPSVDGDNWFGTTQVSLACNSRLIKSRTFVRSQMSVSIFLLIVNYVLGEFFNNQRGQK